MPPFIRNLFLLTGGFCCVASGLVFLPLPTPFGLPLLLVGSALILAGSAMARRYMRQMRGNNQRLHHWLATGERYLPRVLRRILRQTHPYRLD